MLEGKQIEVTRESIEQIRGYLSRPEFLHYGRIYPPNRMMLERLEAALGAGRKVEGADAVFYTHELMEMQLYQQALERGVSHEIAYEYAHQTTLMHYKASQYRAYHPDVFDHPNVRNSKFPFEDEYYTTWGLTPRRTK
jgi:hypothetical protein